MTLDPGTARRGSYAGADSLCPSRWCSITLEVRERPLVSGSQNIMSTAR
jgi:hypothetical protein